MRLFLASKDFGGHADRLRELVGNNRKALVITNARNHKPKDDQREVIEKNRNLFEENGFEFAELDLRDFFGKEDQLREFVDREKPGLVFALGGNYFILMRAFAQSGFDNILKDKLNKDELVYGGSSGGSMVATPDLRYYNDQKATVVPAGYDKESVYDGLKLVDFYISPHQDQNWYKPYIKDRLKKLERDRKPFITLDDSDVYVVDGEQEGVIR